MNLSKSQNVKVGVRCRPMTKSEANKEKNVVRECCRSSVLIEDRNKTTRNYKFDFSFDHRSKQSEIYEAMVSPQVQEVISGYNCTLFAYGQTGTGKTFTMTGERSDQLRYSWHDDPSIGMIPRAVGEIFDKLEQSGEDFAIRVSFLELYNEELFDLLSDKDDMTSLKIFDDAQRKGSITIKNLQELNVENKDSVYSFIEKGLAKRHTAATKMNLQSSRSHSIFIISVHIKETNKTTGEEYLRIGKFNLVDLAGSENIGRSGAVDRRAREAGVINQSLLTLGRVITSLVDKNSHIPYRESKLTRILQDSLGGSTKTSIIATISPCVSSIEETLSTLEYANRAKSIQNKPEVNQKMSKNEMIKNYNMMVERLRKDLDAARTKKGFFVDEENYRSLQEQVELQRDRINLIEERKDFLEEELESLDRNFKLTEEDKMRYQDECNSLSNTLTQTRNDYKQVSNQLRETNEIRRQHRRTEMALHEKAQQLIEKTKLSAEENEILHNKIDQLSDLEKENRRKFTQEIPGTLASGLTSLSDQTSKIKNSLKNDLDQLLEKLTHTQQDIVCGLSEKNKTLKKHLSFLKESILDREESLKTSLETIFNGDKMALEKFLDSQKKHLTNAHKCCHDISQTVDDQMLIFDSHHQNLDQITHRLHRIYENQVQNNFNLNSDLNRLKEELVKYEKKYSEFITSFRTNSDKFLAKATGISNELLDNLLAFQSSDKELEVTIDDLKCQVSDLKSSRENFSATNKASLTRLEHLWLDSIGTIKEEISCFFVNLSEKKYNLQKNHQTYIDTWKCANIPEDRINSLEFKPRVDFVKLERELESSDYKLLVSIPIEKHVMEADESFSHTISNIDKTLEKQSQILGQLEESKSVFSSYRNSGETPNRRTLKLDENDLKIECWPKTRTYRQILSEVRKKANPCLDISYDDTLNTTFNYSSIGEEGQKDEKNK